MINKDNPPVWDFKITAAIEVNKSKLVLRINKALVEMPRWLLPNLGIACVGMIQSYDWQFLQFLQVVDRDCVERCR